VLSVFITQLRGHDLDVGRGTETRITSKNDTPQNH